MSDQKEYATTLKLKYPFEWATGDSAGKQEVTEVGFRRPKGKDIKGMGKEVSLSDLLNIAAKISEFTPRFFDEMDAVDCMAVSEVIGDFLDDGPSTGKTN